MPNDEIEIRALLENLTAHESSCCLFFILGFMSKRDSWHDFVNAARTWYNTSSNSPKAKGG